MPSFLEIALPVLNVREGPPRKEANAYPILYPQPLKLPFPFLFRQPLASGSVSMLLVSSPLERQ